MDPEPDLTFAQRWGQHMAESRITDVVQDSLADRTIPPMTLDEGFTMVVAEIAVMHQLLLDMAVALDDLMQSGSSAGS